MATIELIYHKPYTHSFHIYRDETKLLKNKEYDFTDDTTLRLVEINPFLGKFWWLLVLLNIICGLVGGVADNWKDVKSTQRIVTLNINKVIAKKIKIYVLSASNDFKIEGVENYQIADTISQECPLAVKRVKKANSVLLIAVVLAITIIFAIIAIGLWT
jgi:hypothetical protein